MIPKGSEIGQWSGEKHGRLTILSRVGFDPAGKALVRVLCDCGVEKIIRRNNFLHKTTSCGCLKAEEIRRKFGAPVVWAGAGVIFRQYRRWSFAQQRMFDLSREFFTEIIQHSCYYCGSSPSAKTVKYPEFLYNGIDRVDNTKGYSPDNVVPCCWRCNRIKAAMSQAEFIAHVRRIVQYQEHK